MIVFKELIQRIISVTLVYAPQWGLMISRKKSMIVLSMLLES